MISLVHLVYLYCDRKPSVLNAVENNNFSFIGEIQQQNITLRDKKESLKKDNKNGDRKKGSEGCKLYTAFIV